MCLKFVLIYEDLETKITNSEKLAVIYPRILNVNKDMCPECCILNGIFER